MKHALTARPELAAAIDFVGGEETQVRTTIEFLEAFQIVSVEDYEIAAQALKELAEKHDAFDAKRKAWVNPLKAVAKDIDATFREVLQSLKRGEEILRDRIGAYRVRTEQTRGELIACAAEKAQAGDHAGAQAMIEDAAEFIPPEVEGLSVKVRWTGEVIDSGAIPREYLIPDVAKLAAVTQAREQDPKIPGWRAFPEAAVRTSRKAGA